jgi:hypothetical protein
MRSADERRQTAKHWSNWLNNVAWTITCVLGPLDLIHGAAP